MPFMDILVTPARQQVTAMTTFRTGPHVADDLEQLRGTHGLSGVGAVRYGLVWLWHWWADVGPDVALPALDGAHLPAVTLRPSDLVRFDHQGADPLRKLPLTADDRLMAETLAGLSDAVLEDLYRHAICVARTVLDGGCGPVGSPAVLLDRLAW